MQMGTTAGKTSLIVDDEDAVHGHEAHQALNWFCTAASHTGTNGCVHRGTVALLP